LKNLKVLQLDLKWLINLNGFLSCYSGFGSKDDAAKIAAAISGCSLTLEHLKLKFKG